MVLGRRSVLLVSGTPLLRIGQIAAWQHERVSRRQLRAAGLSDAAITRAAAGGILFRRRRGVFAFGYDRATPFCTETEALLAVRDGAVLSHETALAMWRMRERRSAAQVVDLAVGTGSAGDPVGVRIHRIEVDTGDVRFREGLPVVAPAMALAQSALHLGHSDLQDAFDAGAERGLTSLPELDRVLTRIGPRPGAVALRDLVADYGAWTYTRSKAERLMRARLGEAGLPLPVTNVRRHGYEVDCLWQAQRLVVEVDGFAFHGDRAAFERDRLRDQVLTAAGFTVVRVTWRQLTREPMAVMVRLGRILAAAESTG